MARPALGELVVREPPVPRHGAISNRLAYRLTAFVDEHALGTVSPGDRPGEVLGKMAEWLDAGVRLGWVLDPEACQARVHRGDGSVALLGPDDELDGEDVLPGFRCRLEEVVEPGC